VRNLGTAAAGDVAAGRPYRDLEDFARRTGLPAPALEALATAGAFGCFGLSRRAALWAAGAAASLRPGQLPGTATGMAAPGLPPMTPVEETLADLWATSAYGTHPVAHVRPALAARRVIPASEVRTAAAGSAVIVAGLVTHRQRPPTARGVVFLSLEDETGMVNVIVQPHVWKRYREVATAAPAVVIHGRIERSGPSGAGMSGAETSGAGTSDARTSGAGGAVNLVATALHRLRVAWSAGPYGPPAARWYGGQPQRAGGGLRGVVPPG